MAKIFVASRPLSVQFTPRWPHIISDIAWHTSGSIGVVPSREVLLANENCGDFDQSSGGSSPFNHQKWWIWWFNHKKSWYIIHNEYYNLYWWIMVRVIVVKLLRDDLPQPQRRDYRPCAISRDHRWDRLNPVGSSIEDLAQLVVELACRS